MPSRGNTPAGSRGFALIGLIAALGIVALVLVAGYSTLYARQADAVLERAKQDWLDDAAKALQARYFSDPAATVSGTEDTLFAGAGVVRRWEAHLLLSSELTDPATGIRYVSIAVWMPGLHDQGPPPTYDANTGQFQLCPTGATCADDRIFKTVSGLDTQRQAVAYTRKQLGDLAGKAETYAKASLLRDPEHNLAVNPFRPQVCSLPEYGKLPCLDVYTPMPQTPVGDLFGIAPSEMVDGWGNPVQISNLDGSETVTPPFSMSFRATTPWGQTFVTKAIQPI